MIYHIFNGRVLHLTPTLIKDIINNFTSLPNENVQHFFVIIMTGEKMLYDNIEDNPYDKLFSECNFIDYKLIYSNIHYMRFILSFNAQDKIIYHSVVSPRLFVITNLFLTIAKKCLINNSCFISWGSDCSISEDTFKRRIIAWIKRFIFSKFKNIITLSLEDLSDTKIMYSSSNVIYLPYLSPKSKLLTKIPRPGDDKINIMISHSGWPHNNHIESFDILKKFYGRIRITCPLCYGDKVYIERVINIGKEYFGDDFNYFTDLMSREEYLKLHRTMDIYVSSASVQTGLGAIFCAMESGTKIFLKDNLYQSLSILSYKVGHVEDLKIMSWDDFISPMSSEDALFNINNRNELIAEGSEAFNRWRAIYEE